LWKNLTDRNRQTFACEQETLANRPFSVGKHGEVFMGGGA